MSAVPDPVMVSLPWDQLDTAERQSRWIELCEWVEWFVRRYAVDADVPPCWYQHTAIVDELTALWIAHAGAHYPGMPTTAPISWHEQLERALARIRRWAGSCTSAEHRPVTRARWVYDVEAFMAADKAGPPPTNPLAATAPTGARDTVA